MTMLMHMSMEIMTTTRMTMTMYTYSCDSIDRMLRLHRLWIASEYQEAGMRMTRPMGTAMDIMTTAKTTT